jgi:APA family basic amino acid/polyamine antiporter
MPKDHIELWLSVLPAFYIVVATLHNLPAVYKTSTSGWGVVIMLLGIPVYYLVKKKE